MCGLVGAEKTLNQDDTGVPREEDRRRRANFLCAPALHGALAAPARQVVAADVRQAASGAGAKVQRQERRQQRRRGARHAAPQQRRGCSGGLLPTAEYARALIQKPLYLCGGRRRFGKGRAFWQSAQARVFFAPRVHCRAALASAAGTARRDAQNCGLAALITPRRRRSDASLPPWTRLPRRRLPLRSPTAARALRQRRRPVCVRDT